MNRYQSIAKNFALVSNPISLDSLKNSFSQDSPPRTSVSLHSPLSEKLASYINDLDGKINCARSLTKNKQYFSQETRSSSLVSSCGPCYDADFGSQNDYSFCSSIKEFGENYKNPILGEKGRDSFENSYFPPKIKKIGENKNNKKIEKNKKIVKIKNYSPAENFELFNDKINIIDGKLEKIESAVLSAVDRLNNVLNESSGTKGRFLGLEKRFGLIESAVSKMGNIRALYEDFAGKMDNNVKQFEKMENIVSESEKRVELRFKALLKTILQFLRYFKGKFESFEDKMEQKNGNEPLEIIEKQFPIKAVKIPLKKRVKTTKNVLKLPKKIIKTHKNSIKTPKKALKTPKKVIKSFQVIKRFPYNKPENIFETKKSKKHKKFVQESEETGIETKKTTSFISRILKKTWTKKSIKISSRKTRGLINDYSDMVNSEKKKESG